MEQAVLLFWKERNALVHDGEEENKVVDRMNHEMFQSRCALLMMSLGAAAATIASKNE
ncbi:hypothetical protein PHMEG_00029810 [Phytophthora megakarya]|uniref:Apea-like HEPN domain-containing protein n=1 Tax=Phytophthora megakarya TaxID=4795 RepID=A0A225V1Q2_9STRA|nr:hypothetical protein PHMEG_00029810 [Phytophthora megakarya]